MNYFDRGVEMNLKTEQYARLMAGRIPALVALDLPADEYALRIVVVHRAASQLVLSKCRSRLQPSRSVRK
jgi:hypothetical protein